MGAALHSLPDGGMSAPFIAEHYRRPITIAGFEPLDVLHALAMVLKQIAEGRSEVENQYAHRAG